MSGLGLASFVALTVSCSMFRRVPLFVQKSDATTAKQDVELPAGWTWTDDWQVDLNRAVDENGMMHCADVLMYCNDVLYT